MIDTVNIRRVLVSGANGFVGRILCSSLSHAGCIVRAAVRNESAVVTGAAETVVVGNLGGDTDWRDAMRDVDAVIHLAARAHVPQKASEARLYHETNALGAKAIAEAATRAGVARLIYLSTVKVNGEETVGVAFRASDPPRPQDAYAESKLMGEQLATEAVRGSGTELVIVRSPLVYGPGVRANFLALMRWIESGWPIPLGSVRNRRSLIGVWNLCDLLRRCLEAPAAAGRIWMASDGVDLSTPDLIRHVAAAMKRPARLVAIAPSLLKVAGALTGRGAMVARLTGSLTVDISETQRDLGWSPPMTVEEGLERTVSWYLGRGDRAA